MSTKSLPLISGFFILPPIFAFPEAVPLILDKTSPPNELKTPKLKESNFNFKSKSVSLLVISKFPFTSNEAKLSFCIVEFKVNFFKFSSPAISKY